jgi:hypothetical protein
MATIISGQLPSEFSRREDAALLNQAACRNQIGRSGLDCPPRNRIQAKPPRTAKSHLVPDGRHRQIRDALAESDFFGALADDEIDRLIEQGRSATYRSGAVVFRRGDPAEEVLTVLCGRIKLSSTSPRGKEVLFDLIEPGHSVGELALLEGRTRPLDATAVKPSAIFAPGP